MKFQKSYNERNEAQERKENERKENNYLAKKGEKYEKAWTKGRSVEWGGVGGAVGRLAKDQRRSCY